MAWQPLALITSEEHLSRCLHCSCHLSIYGGPCKHTQPCCLPARHYLPPVKRETAKLVRDVLEHTPKAVVTKLRDR